MNIDASSHDRLLCLEVNLVDVTCIWGYGNCRTWNPSSLLVASSRGERTIQQKCPYIMQYAIYMQVVLGDAAAADKRLHVLSERSAGLSGAKRPTNSMDSTGG